MFLNRTIKSSVAQQVTGSITVSGRPMLCRRAEQAKKPIMAESEEIRTEKLWTRFDTT